MTVNTSHKINYQDALQLLLQQASPKKAQKVSIDKALGMKLAQEVRADRAYPPFNRAAMDGIAIAYADFKQGITSYSIRETLYAGCYSERTLNTGEAYKIMTGAAVPFSADTVIRQEDLLETGTHYHVKKKELRYGENIAFKGEDLADNDLLLTPGTLITPPVIGLLAAVGIDKPCVEMQPNVGLFTTGDELIPIHEMPNAIQIRNSNQHLLRALLAVQGIIPTSQKQLPDDPAILYQELKAGLNCDTLLVNAGVSAGERDYVPEVLDALGVHCLFNGVAIKPAKPVWCGITPHGGMVFGLPGNPFSCMVSYQLFVKPFLRGAPPTSYPLPIAVARTKKNRIDEFFPVRVIKETKQLMPIPINGSGDIRFGLHADGLALHAVDSTHLKPNDTISYYPF